MSSVWCPENKGYQEVSEAVQRAEAQGIFVVSCSLNETSNHKYYFHGLAIDRSADREDFASYSVIPWDDYVKKISHIPGAAAYYEKLFELHAPEEILLVPIDARTVSSPTGIKDYFCDNTGGWSWAVPSIAALYVLASQVKPDVTPGVFWREALRTGEPLTIKKGDESYSGKIVNPERLMKTLKGKTK